MTKNAHHTIDQAEATEVTLDGVSRRTFLNVAGASAALAGVGLTGCIRKPVTKIVPYASRPEDLVEGVALHFATAHQEGASVTGIVVESHEGRPTKIAGNKAHPDSLGATSATTQGSVLDLYDLDRSVLPHGKRSESDAATLSWEAAWQTFERIADEAKKGPLAVVLPAVMSPTVRRLVAEARQAMPAARFFQADLLWPAAAMAAARAIGGAGAYAQTHLDKADVVAAFDADVLVTEPGAVRLTKGYAKKRKITGPNQPMSRIYALEPTFSSTGAIADHRARIKAGDVGKALAQLARELGAHGVTVDAAVVASLPQATLPAKADRLVKALARDLAGNRGRAVVCVGRRQPAWVHALGHAINAALGALADGGPQSFHKDPTLPEVEDLGALAQALSTKAVGAVFAIDTNPAFSAPGALGLPALLAQTTLVHAGTHDDETGKLATLHLPISHYLEAWGDLQSLSGVATVQQPLIEPLHHTPSALEVLGRLVRGRSVGGHDLVMETWKLDAAAWETWLHDGVRPVALETPASLDWSKAAELVRTGSQAETASGTEVIFELDPNILDGRHANNGWLRELPHPMSKLTWENAAHMNQKTAGALDSGDLVKVTVGSQTVELPVQILPGMADDVVAIALGHGRRGVGRVADQHGADTYPLLPASLETTGWFAAGQFAASGGAIKLANLQPRGNSLTPRPASGYGPKAAPETYAKGGLGENRFEPRMMALEATLAQYAANPTFPDALNDRVMPDEKVKSWMYPDPPNEQPLAGGASTDDVYLNGVHQWGMSIDLNACTGCNACTIACQAENNIVVVGKDQVAMGREMHWIRIDRYFSGDEDVEAVLQPLPCQQCETAPCEAVCPVKATAHSNEGLNDMIYNRCIGTRYCSNNCPFKVRRFNWFNFNLDLHPLEQMQKNPDVTVRFRGVMEKCTYCVQRINRAKIEAKVHGDGRVKDGAIVTACQEVCPADAIVFGDLRDESSAVVKAKKEPRTYQLLRELNMRARTTYQAKLRNPNPDLV